MGMNRKELSSEILSKKSYLCLGLDPDREKMPAHLLSGSSPLYTFCKEIADAAADFCVAFKVNTAFFEAEGSTGFEQLEKLCHYLHTTYPRHLLIADAKRGDIGNTSDRYAKAFFEQMTCDAITLHPYMGKDSLAPFLTYKNKWSIVLGLTSNPGAEDFELLELANGSTVYREVLRKTVTWGSPENLMFVIGATQGTFIENIRRELPDYFFLVPGVGTQGGDLQTIISKGKTDWGGLLINVSRDILYVSSGINYAEEAANKAAAYAKKMAATFD